MKTFRYRLCIILGLLLSISVYPQFIGNGSSADVYVFFNFSSSTLTEVTKKQLDDVAEKLENEPKLSIKVVGHADYIDKEDFNQELSQKRSAKVAEYLVSKGISSDRISMAAYGETLPISNNESDLGRKLNRRVEIYFITENEIDTNLSSLDQAVNSYKGKKIARKEESRK
ncbi:MAG: OmpA family protein [Cytophagia bacterium]|nr:OmpA family protein [Cytophagia bacterium]